MAGEVWREVNYSAANDECIAVLSLHSAAFIIPLCSAFPNDRNVTSTSSR
jgi:hypothetical protein